jgi:hypothetical protein
VFSAARARGYDERRNTALKINFDDNERRPGMLPQDYTHHDHGTKSATQLATTALIVLLQTSSNLCC